MKLAVSEAAGAGLLRTIDRRWSLWPHDDQLLPAGRQLGLRQITHM